MRREQQKEILHKKLEEKAIKLTNWLGSTESLVIHTIVFAFFILMIILGANFDTIMLVLTTLVSLEAIYLAIFIQMSVNRHSKQLEIVSEDIEEIQEDVEEIQKDVEGIEEDIDEIQEDVEGIEEDIEEIQEDVEEIEEDLENVNNKTMKSTPEPKKQTNDELIVLIKNLNNEIIELKTEIKALQKPVTTAKPKTESLKQKVTKLLKK